MQILDSFGKKYGLNITFVNTLGDFNGFYKPGTNQIVVGLDASEGAVTRTVGHEVYHYIKDANKEGAQKIEDFVLKSLKKLKGEEWVQNKLDSYDKSVYKTEQERIDELVADCMFDVFTNEKTVQEFVKQDRILAQRVLDRVKTLIADIRNIYNKLIARGSDEIAALRDELETLEKIRDLFFEALDETAPAVNQEQKNTAEAVKYSFARASGKPQLTYLAEAMEQEGATKDEIWKKLGVIRDASGIWVYEIDDSDMKIYPNGDARLRNEEGYKRMNALFEKAFVNGEQISEFEKNEYSELHKKYAIQKKIAIDIGDFVVHDKLFEEYPEIAKATFGFDDLLSKGKRGYYDRTLNEIVVDNSLKKEIDKGQLGKTAIHEIQHAIQHFDDRAGGASIEFWRKKNFEKLQELQNTLADKKIERTEFFAKLDNELKVKIREVNNADDYDLKDGYTEKNILQLKLLDDDATGNYQRLLDMDYAIRKLEAEIEYQKKTDNSEVQYYDTAGEIEARETADRLKMTVDERAERMPNLGWERAVFAEGISANYDIVNLDNGLSYIKSSRNIIKGNDKAQWRKQITNFFNKSLKINKQIQITTIDGTVLYITKNTADKARSDSVIENGISRPLTDTEFFVKLEASSHIDELAEISRINNKGKKFPDTKNHKFASDGFTYRTVYFEDSNKQYYKITLSIGHSGNVATIYNVGKIKKDSMPNGNIISMIGSKADILSTDSISQMNNNVKKKLSTKPNNPIREEVSDYIGSSAHVQSVIKTIDKRYRLAGKKKLNEKSIERFANKILSQTNSKYSKEQLTERLTALFVINPKTCKYN